MSARKKRLPDGGQELYRLFRQNCSLLVLPEVPAWEHLSTVERAHWIWTYLDIEAEVLLRHGVLRECKPEPKCRPSLTH